MKCFDPFWLYESIDEQKNVDSVTNWLEYHCSISTNNNNCGRKKAHTHAIESIESRYICYVLSFYSSSLW